MQEQYEGKIINKVEVGRWKVGPDTWDIVYVIVEKVTPKESDQKVR